jgi:hypothetical protein
MAEGIKDITKTFNYLNTIIQLNVLKKILIKKGIITNDEFNEGLKEQINEIDIDSMKRLLKGYYKIEPERKI